MRANHKQKESHPLETRLLNLAQLHKEYQKEGVSMKPMYSLSSYIIDKHHTAESALKDRIWYVQETKLAVSLGSFEENMELEDPD